MLIFTKGTSIRYGTKKEKKKRKEKETVDVFASKQRNHFSIKHDLFKILHFTNKVISLTSLFSNAYLESVI